MPNNSPATKMTACGAVMELTVKWTDNAVMLTHPEVGVLRVIRDSGSAHYLEQIAAQHNAYPQLVEALRDLLVAAHGAAHANESDDANFYNHIHTAHNLLRSLGEKV